MDNNLLEELKWQFWHGHETLDFLSQIKELFYLMERYFAIYDLDHGTIHGRIFYALYLMPYSESYADISFNNNIHERTLNRYVIKYNNLAKKIINKKYIEIKEKYSLFFKK